MTVAMGAAADPFRAGGRRHHLRHARAVGGSAYPLRGYNAGVPGPRGLNRLPGANDAIAQYVFSSPTPLPARETRD